MPKKYDLFISHNSSDKKFALKLASDLKNSKIKVWFDTWEMKPGDRLRDKINRGIKGSKYCLVVLSENSIKAPWVKIELDSAMIEEIESQRVVVVPILYGKIKEKEIPADLKGKFFLDFRHELNYSSNINKIIDLFELPKRERREFLKRLRLGPKYSDNSIESLTDFALHEHDQTIQKAALSGLLKYSTPQAFVGIAIRLTDVWGCAALDYCIDILGKTQYVESLILLSSTLFFDKRYISEKVTAIRNILTSLGDDKALKELNTLNNRLDMFREPKTVNSWVSILKASSNKYISNGCIFGANFCRTIGSCWQASLIVPCSFSEFDESKEFVENVIPGLFNTFILIERKLYAERDQYV